MSAPLSSETSGLGLRKIFDSAYQFIGLLTPEGRLIEANRSALELVKSTREAVLGLPFWETPWWSHDPTLQKKIRRAIAAGARGRFVRFEATHHAADGRTVYVDFSLTPIKNDQGKVIFLLPEGRDITERKQVETERLRLERELRRQLIEKEFLIELGATLARSLDYEEQLLDAGQLLVNFMADFCCVFLIEGDSVRRLKTVTSSPDRAWVADGLAFYPLDPQSSEPVWEILKTRAPILMPEIPEQDVRAYARDAEHFRLLEAMNPRSMLGVPLLARGRLVGVMTLVSSDARRIYCERDVDLAMEVARRAAVYVDNARLYHEAQEANRARDELLGVVAHDLRNPIHSIQLGAAILRTQLQPDCQGRVETTVDAILASAERANRLIRDLLDVSRGPDGKIGLNKQRVAMQPFMQELIQTYELLVREGELELHVDLPDILPTVLLDKDRITQVFDNLISNAIKFTTRPGVISIGATSAPGEVRFWVRDTGCGIPEENLPHLFNRFWQGGRGDGRGAGLGLAIVKAVVEAHKGQIQVESTVGHGSAFYVTLPVI